MKKIFFLFNSAFLILHAAFAQSPLVKQWDYRFGGADYDWLTCFLQTSDGGYILGGWSTSDISGDKTQQSWGIYDYWIVKTDSLGNKQWDKDFGGTGDDVLYSIYQTVDGGYILGGYSLSGISGDKSQQVWGSSDYWIVKTDSLGNKQWDKDFGGTGDEAINSLQQTFDGGYILGGQSNSGISGDKTEDTIGGYDYWIIKTDSLGNKQWDKDFGGTDIEHLYSLQQTTDGGYILSGYSLSGINGHKTQASWGNYDYWIIKTDSLGNKQWDKDFGGTNYDILHSIEQTADGGYILGGNSNSGISGDKAESTWGDYDYWIVKTDPFGIKQWDKDFGGVNREELWKVSQTTDGGYLISGDSYSNISGDKTENNFGQEQTWVIKTDSQGNVQWDKTIFTSGLDDYGLAIQERDGCYAIANCSDGGIAEYKTQASQGLYDYWIIKFCDTTTCNASIPELAQRGDTLFVPQNYAGYQWYYGSAPISGATNYFYIAPQSGNYNIEVTDSSGCRAGAGIINVVAGFAPSPQGEGWGEVFPNPTGGTFEIKYYSEKNSSVTIEIMNVLGEIIFKEEREIKQGTNSLSFGEGWGEAVWDGSGIYILQLTTTEKTYRTKVVKQ